MGLPILVGRLAELHPFRLVPRSGPPRVVEDDPEPRGFVKFRSSRWFIRLIFGLCAPWAIASIFFHLIDPGLGYLNFFLSFEASCAACFILHDGARQLRILLKILRSHGDLMARVEARDSRIEELVARIEARDRRIERLVKHLDKELEGAAGE